jgi:gluconolactonase
VSHALACNCRGQSQAMSSAAPVIRTVASGLRFPEGPVARLDGSVLLVEIAKGTLTRVLPDGEVSVVAHMGGGPNGAAVGPDGAVYVCNNGGFTWVENERGLQPFMQEPADYAGGKIQRVDLTNGAVQTLYESGPHSLLKGPNDLVFDAHGGFYFTDFGKARGREMDRGAVYYARSDGSLITEVAFPLITPNGCALSPDGDHLYVAETLTGRVWAFEIVSPGEIRRAPWPSPNGGRLVAGVGGYQLLDSMAVDSAGNICVATPINSGITVLSHDGATVRHVPLPGDPYVTNICFGGQELKTAFVTLSSTGRLIAFEWDRAGAKLNYQDCCAQL